MTNRKAMRFSLTQLIGGIAIFSTTLGLGLEQPMLFANVIVWAVFGLGAVSILKLVVAISSLWKLRSLEETTSGSQVDPIRYSGLNLSWFNWWYGPVFLYYLSIVAVCTRPKGPPPSLAVRQPINSFADDIPQSVLEFIHDFLFVYAIFVLAASLFYLPTSVALSEKKARERYGDIREFVLFGWSLFIAILLGSLLLFVFCLVIRIHSWNSGDQVRGRPSSGTGKQHRFTGPGSRLTGTTYGDRLGRLSSQDSGKIRGQAARFTTIYGDRLRNLRGQAARDDGFSGVIYRGFSGTGTTPARGQAGTTSFGEAPSFGDRQG